MSNLDYLAFDCDNHYYEAGQAQASGAGRRSRLATDRDGAPEAGAA